MTKNTEKKDNIKIVEKPEYADMVINYVELHGNVFRNPKEWYPELLYNSNKHQPARISTQIKNVDMDMPPNSGLTMEVKFLMSEKQNIKYKNAINSGEKFKIYIPKDRMIKIIFDKNLRESIKASNRSVGFQQYKTTEGYGELLSLDIEDGTLIIRLLVNS